MDQTFHLSFSPFLILEIDSLALSSSSSSRSSSVFVSPCLAFSAWTATGSGLEARRTSSWRDSQNSEFKKCSQALGADYVHRILPIDHQEHKRFIHLLHTWTCLDMNLEFLLSRQIPKVPLVLGLKSIENDNVSLVDSLTTLMTSVTIGSSNVF